MPTMMLQDTLRRVRDWSTKPDGSRIVCHTIALCAQNEPQCVTLMRGIARVTGGEMNHVNRFEQHQENDQN